MVTDPLSGLLLIATGALSAASFYVPFTKVINISWEVYWLIGGFFSWIVVPLSVAIITIPSLLNLYGSVSAGELFYTLK